jgi:hypothetical protein
MRCLASILAAATLLAAPLAAQERATTDTAPAAHPLPAALAPSTVERAAVRPPRGFDPLELGLFTGVVVGMTVGGVYGSLTHEDRCARQGDECMLSREVETGLFAIMGGSVGMLIGAGTSYLLNRPERAQHPAPLTVAPDAGGALRVELTLRH